MGRLLLVVIVSLGLVPACSSIRELTHTPTPTASTGTPFPTPSATPASTSDSEQVLLRLAWEPTMAPYPGRTVETPPRFTLYRDGRAIFVDYSTSTADNPQFRLRQAQLSPEQIDDLIRFALEDGGLGEARMFYTEAPVTDAGNTIFEIHGSGVDKLVSAYAVGHTGETDPDAAVLAKLELLAGRLEDFASDVENGKAQDLGDYDPEAFLVTLDSPVGPAPNPKDVREWPWDDLQLSDFLAQPGQARQLTPELTKAIADPPLAAENNVLVAGADGAVHLIRLRPLLPDEVALTS